jgi:hypothetical protein
VTFRKEYADKLKQEKRLVLLSKMSVAGVTGSLCTRSSPKEIRSKQY